MIGVVERQYSNGVEQTVSLSTSSAVRGSNYLKVRFVGGGGRTDAPSQSFTRLTEASVRREMIQAAPGVALRRSSAFLQNAYGPFAYAAGASASGDTCLFAWQQIRSRTGGIGRDFGMIQVRVRLCDRQASERELLSLMYGFTITGNFGGKIWNPYGTPAPLDASIGASGQMIYPDAPKAPPIAFGYREAKPVPPAPRVRVASKTSPDRPKLPNAPRVPLPTVNAATPDTIPTPAGTAPSPRTATVTVPSPACLGGKMPATGCQ